VVHGGPKIARTKAGPATTPVEILHSSRSRFFRGSGGLNWKAKFCWKLMLARMDAAREPCVRGLGHGLDEAATAAANKMRFKPACGMGTPVESTAVVHVTFQMAYLDSCQLPGRPVAS